MYRRASLPQPEAAVDAETASFLASCPNANSAAPITVSEATLANQLTHTFASTGSVTYSCSEGTHDVGFYQGRLTAIRVEALH